MSSSGLEKADTGSGQKSAGNTERLPYRDYGTTYHAHHRNSLIASCLLILICLPGVQIDLSKLLFVTKFPPTGPALGILLWLSALYFFSAFLIEWHLNARAELSQVTTEINELVAAAEDPIQLLQDGINLDRRIVATWQERFDNIPPIDQAMVETAASNAIAAVNEVYHSRMDRLVTALANKVPVEILAQIREPLAEVQSAVDINALIESHGLDGVLYTAHQIVVTVREQSRVFEAAKLFEEQLNVLKKRKRVATRALRWKAWLIGLSVPGLLFLGGTGWLVYRLYEGWPPVEKAAAQALPATGATPASKALPGAPASQLVKTSPGPHG